MASINLIIDSFRSPWDLMMTSSMFNSSWNTDF